MNETMKQGMVTVLKNLRHRVKCEDITKDEAFPDWKAVFSEWNLENTPSYHLTVNQFLELTKA